MRNETILEHSSQLNALHTFPLLRTPGLGVLRLGGEMARHENREKWQRELNRSYHACGCDTGAKGLLIGLLAGLIAAAAGSAPWFSWQAAGIVFGSALAGAAIGKIIGLARAQIRLGRTIREIAAAVRPREPIVVDDISCG